MLNKNSAISFFRYLYCPYADTNFKAQQKKRKKKGHYLQFAIQFASTVQSDVSDERFSSTPNVGFYICYNIETY